MSIVASACLPSGESATLPTLPTETPEMRTSDWETSAVASSKGTLTS